MSPQKFLITTTSSLVEIPSQKASLASHSYLQSLFHSAKEFGVSIPSEHCWHFIELKYVPNSVTSEQRTQSQSKCFVCLRWWRLFEVSHSTSVYEIVRCSLSLMAFGDQNMISLLSEKLFDKLGRHECSNNDARWYKATHDGFVSGNSWPFMCAIPLTFNISSRDHLLHLKNLQWRVAWGD